MPSIYVLIEPLSNEIRYVGVTTESLSSRLSRHMRVKGTYHRARWIESLRRRGLRPRIELLQEVDASWQDAERYWISYFRSIGCDLTNSTDGGEGTPGHRANRTPLSNEHKRKISESLKKHVWAEGRREAVSRGHIGIGRGIPKSPEHRAAISAALAGKPRKPWSQERRRKFEESRVQS